MQPTLGGLRRTSIRCLTASRTVRSTQCRYKSNHLGRLQWLPCRVSYFGAIKMQAISIDAADSDQPATAAATPPDPRSSGGALLSPVRKHYHPQSIMRNLTRWYAQKRKTAVT